jgi:hypothetical protein
MIMNIRSRVLSAWSELGTLSERGGVGGRGLFVVRPQANSRRLRIQNVIENGLVVGLTCVLGLLVTVSVTWPERPPDLLGIHVEEVGIGALTVVAQTAGTMLALFGAALLFGLETYRQSYGSRYWNALSTSLNLGSLVAFHLLCLVTSFAAFASLGSESERQSILLADLALVLLAISVTEVIAAAHKIIVEPRRLAYLDEVLLMDNMDCTKQDGKIASGISLTKETVHLPVSYLGEAAQLAVIRRDDYALSQVLERSWVKLAGFYEKDPTCIQMTGKHESPLRVDCDAYAFVMGRARQEAEKTNDVNVHEALLRHIAPVLEFAGSHNLSMLDVWGVIGEWHGIVDTALEEGWDTLLWQACPLANSIVFREPFEWNIPTEVVVKWLGDWSVRAASTGNASLLRPLLLCEASVIRSARKRHPAVRSGWADHTVQTMYETLRKVVGKALDVGMGMAVVLEYGSPLGSLFLSEMTYSADEQLSAVVGAYLDITRDVLERGVFPSELQSEIGQAAEVVLSRLRSDPPKPVGWKANSLVIALQEVCTHAVDRETYESDCKWAIALLRHIHEAATHAGETELTGLCWDRLALVGALSEDEALAELESHRPLVELPPTLKHKPKRKPKPGTT